jgi:hypothetical protein
MSSRHHAGILRRAVRGAGGASRDRTGDLLLAKQALSQLSYGPIVRLAKIVETIFADITPQAAGKKRGFCRLRRRESPLTLVGLGGVAPPTSPLSGVRSN